VVKVYFNESLYDIYNPYMAPLISTVTDKILKPLAPTRDATSFYAYGLDVSSLAGTKPRPSIPYLTFPLIGLTWLIQYLVCRVSHLGSFVTASTVRSLPSVVSDVDIAASNSFTENTKKVIRWLFFCGSLRAQEAFLV